MVAGTCDIFGRDSGREERRAVAIYDTPRSVS